MSGRLEGKVALITGTARGIGRATAVRFAREGALVVGCDLEPDGNADTIRRVTELGGEMTGMAPVDLGDPDQARAWVDEAAAVHGRIDVLVNNAGMTRPRPIAECTVDDWRYSMRNEVDLVFFVSKFAWPYLEQHGGVIISTASEAAHVGLAGYVAHCAGKAAVIAMSRAMAAEGAPRGIRCNTISPGPVARPENPRPPEYVKASGDATALKRQGTVDEVAAVAVFLASDDASYMTAADVVVDGGKGGTRYQPPRPTTGT